MQKYLIGKRVTAQIVTTEDGATSSLSGAYIGVSDGFLWLADRATRLDGDAWDFSGIVMLPLDGVLSITEDMQRPQS